MTLLADRIAPFLASNCSRIKCRDYGYEGRTFVMQGLEAGYIISSQYLSKWANDGWIPFRQSSWNYKSLSGTAKEWVSISACISNASPLLGAFSLSASSARKFLSSSTHMLPYAQAEGGGLISYRGFFPFQHLESHTALVHT